MSNKTNHQGYSIPQIAGAVFGAYLGWKHGGEIADFGKQIEDSAPFIVYAASQVPFIAKLTGAYIEGKILAKVGKTMGRVAQSGLDKIVDRGAFSTPLTESLDSRYDPSRSYRVRWVFPNIEMGHICHEIIQKSRQKKKFVALSEDYLRKKYGNTMIDRMIEKDYLEKQSKFGREFLSMTHEAAIGMFGVERSEGPIELLFGRFDVKEENGG